MAVLTADLVWSNYRLDAGGSPPGALVGTEPWSDDSQATYTDSVIRTASGGIPANTWAIAEASLPGGVAPEAITGISGVIECRVDNTEAANGNGDLRSGVEFYADPDMDTYLGNLGTPGGVAYLISDAELAIETHPLTEFYNESGSYDVTGTLFAAILAGPVTIAVHRYSSFPAADPANFWIRCYKLILTVTYDGPDVGGGWSMG